MDQKFEIGYGVTHTLRETAEYFGISYERVRQLERSAFRKIRKALERDGIDLIK